MAKTIKQIADEIGVSKTAVRNKIANLGLQSSLRKIGNQFAIDEKQENLIKTAFLQDETQTKIANQVCEKSETSLRLVSDLVSVLQQQLQEKDKQIENLTDELAKEREYSRKQSEKIALLADQAQKLQLAQMKPQLPNEIKLTDEEKQGRKEKDKTNLRRMFGLDVEEETKKEWYEFWKL